MTRRFDIAEQHHGTTLLKFFYHKAKKLRSKDDIVRSYTKEEAIKEGKKMARADLQKLLDEEDEIVGEKILHESIENGKVKLSIHYQVIEDIAIGQPIIQGD